MPCSTKKSHQGTNLGDHNFGYSMSLSTIITFSSQKSWFINNLRMPSLYNP